MSGGSGTSTVIPGNCPEAARAPWRRRVGWAVGLGALLLLAFTCSALYLPPIARFLDVSEPPEVVDYVMVLGGGSANRPFAAAALFNKGLARQVLIPHDTLLPEAEDGILPAEHEIDREVLVASGVPVEAIHLLDGNSDNTLDEARALCRFLEERPGSSVAVVTTTWHTRRARLLFRSIVHHSTGRVLFLGVPTDGYHEKNWWRFEAGFVAYALEYTKLILYGMRQPSCWVGLSLLSGFGILAYGIWRFIRNRRMLSVGRSA